MIFMPVFYHCRAHLSITRGRRGTAWTRESCLLHRHPREAGSPRQGQGSTMSLPSATNGGILRSLTLPLNDVQELRCAAGRGDNVDAQTRGYRHSEAAGRGIPLSGAEQYVAATMEEPTVGLRRRKVRSAPLPPCGESFARSLAPPFRPRSASPGSRPRRGLSLRSL